MTNNNSINYTSDTMLDFTLTEPGEYLVTIDTYKVIPAVYNLVDPTPDSERNTSYLIDSSLPADAIIKQEHLRITASDNLHTFTIKLYPARVPYFMKAINKQFDYELTGISLKNVLEFLKTHAFNIQFTYHPRYGEQFDFRACE